MPQAPRANVRQESKDAQKAIDKEAKRNRGAMSCAECRRLKLKCDKTVPCSSCKRRGCSAICPNGSLITGQGTRFVLADTEKLHQKIAQMSDRIRQLEDALVILQTSVSPGEPHPLLQRELLDIKSIIDLHVAVDEAKTTKVQSNEQADNESQYIEAFGTLALRDDGAATFYGPSAGSESLLIGESAEPSAPPSSSGKESVSHDLPGVVQHLSNSFPLAPVFNENVDLNYLVQNFLPPWQRARQLSELYLSQAPWFFGAVTKRQLLEECLPLWYAEATDLILPGSVAPPTETNSSEASKNPHELALLFVIFCFGALTDATLPPAPDNDEANMYFKLTRAALNLEPVLDRPPSVATVQTLALLAIYQGLCSGENSIESTWGIFGLATKLAQSIGLHRDCARWQLPSSEVQKRRALFWELFITDGWQSLATGRLATFYLPYIDCELANDPDSFVDDDGSVVPSFPAWKAQFGFKCISAVIQNAQTAKVPKYSLVIELDRRVRDMDLPAYSQRPPLPGAGLAETMKHYMPINYRHLTLLYIHRCFFAEAVSNSPSNPMNSHFAPSFLAGYRSACELLGGLRTQFDLFPVQIARFWVLWTHAFSSSVMLASVVTHASGSGTRSKITSAALAELRRAVDLFKEASIHGGRAGKFLPILQRLLQKAEHAYGTATPAVTRSQDIFAPSTQSRPKDELSIFSGQINRVSTKVASLSTSFTSTSSVARSPEGGSHNQCNSSHASSSPVVIESPMIPSFARLHPGLRDQWNNFEGDLNAQLSNAQKDDYYTEEDAHMVPPVESREMTVIAEEPQYPQQQQQPLAPSQPSRSQHQLYSVNLSDFHTSPSSVVASSYQRPMRDDDDTWYRTAEYEPVRHAPSDDQAVGRTEPQQAAVQYYHHERDLPQYRPSQSHSQSQPQGKPYEEVDTRYIHYTPSDQRRHDQRVQQPQHQHHQYQYQHYNTDDSRHYSDATIMPSSSAWKPEDDVALYDEVTEDQYKAIVRGRLQKDDFVVDDGVSGYMDNGMDDWTGQEEVGEEDEDEDDYANRKKSKKKARDIAKSAKEKPKITPSIAKPSMSAYRPALSAEQEEDFMANLLGGIDAAPVSAPKKSKKRKPSPMTDYDDAKPDQLSSPVPYRTGKGSSTYNYDAYSSDGLADDGGVASNPPSSDFEDEAVVSPKKKARIGNGSAMMTPAIERMGKLDMQSGPDDGFSSSMDFGDIDMDQFMEVDDIDVPTKPFVKKEVVPVKLDVKPVLNANGTSTKEDVAAPSWLSVYDSLPVAADEALGSGSMFSTSRTSINALNDDGSLQMFWLDYLENNGKLYLIGKVKDRASNAWVSACLAVEGIQRNLFILPRPLRVVEEENDDGETMMVETDVVPKKGDVYDDFDRIRRKLGIKGWKARWVKRKYAFDVRDVPKETQWMKVLYSYEEPQIPQDACSPNILKMFGTNTSIFELFVLKRKIMGPCWLSIRNATVENQGISWCKLEARVLDPKDITPMGDNAPEPPPLTIMSLAVRTVVNHKDNKREVVCVTARVWTNMQLDDPTPPEQLRCAVHTFVRPLDRFPPNFEVRAKASSKGIIAPMKNERMLLNNFIATLYKADPDILVGHDFLGVFLDSLLGRMKDLGSEHWSRLGRFRRSKLMGIGRQGTNIKFLAGRLLCDLSSDAARSMISSTTWSLTEMCRTHLKSERQDIDPDDTAMYFDGSVSSPDMLMTFVRHCELDAHYQMAIASKVQILPLTRQLTNLAGNAWNKTLNGGRAERNEYILLHEFHRLKYICPDKSYGRKPPKPEPEADDADAEGGGGKASKGKRDKYKGGLVFEPKRGLWDKYILVMDFNSLYPSIIQEYNIDFTTVERLPEEEADDKIPEPPSSEVPQGVLPRLIATLVQRRRQVKSLMKDRSITHAKLLQYDIKQQALKLTANSMYGCLGFENSRFYARPLAALTTFKGREILTHTRELAESLQLDVVYGDTDSVFVNSNVTELSDALKISVEFKKAVNDRYKLLEIDLDGVFARLLLLQKKKYAALKVEDGTRTTTEVKGLDMKRREYCALSKNVSQYVLEQILSGEPTEIVVENIHEYLSTVGSNVRSGKVKLDDFVIHKRLGKNPEDYPDAKSQPHVQVALRIKARGGSARVGDVIPYIFCLGQGEETAKSGQADRAKHPDEFKKASAEGFSIDYEHYLGHQVLPPIERLCEPIEGTDRARLAECLGLDPGRYRATGGTEAGSTFTTLDSQVSDAERFRDANPFLVRCRGCQGEMSYAPIWERESSILQPSGPTCPACNLKMTPASMQAQLEVQIRACIARYYQGWTVCDDTTCGHRTRSMAVYGRRCTRTGCRGNVRFEYTDVDLYNQLRYFAMLFDPEKAVKATLGSASHAEVKHLMSINGKFLQRMASAVDKYIDQCGRRWVDLGALFSVMKL